VKGTRRKETETVPSDTPSNIKKTDYLLFLRDKKLKGRGEHEGIV